MEITDISQFNGVYRISFDEGETLKLDKRTFKKLGLSTGADVDLDDLAENVKSIQQKYAYESALYMLDRTSRTSAQIRSSLIRKGYMESVADECVKRLESARLIDDEYYAQRMVESQASKSMSKSMLKRKMMSKGIPHENIDAALESVSDERQIEAVCQTAEKLYRRYENLPKREARGKLSMALARRGFNWDDINLAVGKLLNGDE